MPTYETTDGHRIQIITEPGAEDFRIRVDNEDYGLINQTDADDYLAEAAKRGADELFAAIKTEPWIRRF